MLVDLHHRLNVIEEKLLVGYTLSSVEDIEPLKSIIVSFHRIWKWYKEYSELASKVDSNLFRNILADMSSTLSAAAPSELSSSVEKIVYNDTSFVRSAASYPSKLKMICDYCDIDFPLLNNDIVFAYQMHEQTPEHVEAVNIFQMLHLATASEVPHAESTEENNSDASRSNDELELEAESCSDTECDRERAILSVSTNKMVKNEVIFEADVWIETRGSEKFCILCNLDLPDDDSQLRSHINGQMHREDAFWIWTQGNKYYCNLCDVTLISLNQLYDHLDGRRHEEILGEYERYWEKRNRKSDIDFDENAEERSDPERSNRNECESSNNWIEREANGKFCDQFDDQLSSDSSQSHNGRISREDSSWIWSQGSKYYCSLCDVTLISLGRLHNHLAGRQHEKTLQEHEPTSDTDCRDREPMLNSSLVHINVSSPVDVYRLDYASRLTYFLNKTCILFRSYSAPTTESEDSSTVANTDAYYNCFLCSDTNTVRIEEGQVGNHLLENAHQAGVAGVIEKSNASSVSFEVGIFHGEGRGAGRECCVCGIKLPEDDAFAYLNHLESSCHAKAVQSHFNSPLFQKWEKGIILRYGNPYCVLCKSCLPNETSMQKHINAPSHRNKL